MGVKTKTPAACSPALQYAEAVLAGKLPACRWVRFACERHLRDLETGQGRGLRFDHKAAQHALDFFRFLRHSKGEWGGQEFRLELWQQFIVASLFGWKREDGYRRFRIAYIEVPRKNGKSQMAAGIGLYLFYADREPGAEVYVGATKKEQAKITWDEAERMVRSSPALRNRIGIFRNNLHVTATASKFEPLGADADTLDGLNAHGVIIDELHAHPNRTVWDVLRTAKGARRQPLLFAITTAGYDQESICWEVRDYSTKVLQGVLEDDSRFAYIATLDEGDAWQDEAVWQTANPNLGISVKLDDMRELAREARESPAAQNTFRRLRLNEWTEQAERAIDMDDWRACGEHVADPNALRGQRCYAGLDLSSTTDLTALVLYFPNDDGPRQTLPFLWMPADSMIKRERDDGVPFSAWRRDGHLLATEGNIVDYQAVRAHLNRLANLYQIAEVAYDPWNATGLATQLEGDGFVMVPVRQGWQSLNEPTKELLKLVAGRKLAHGNHPVLRWMASNLAVLQDPAGNLKPAKNKSKDRIDGIVALIMAIARALVQPKEQSSVYERRGLLIL